MKISNPRFLNAGNQRELNVEFPACLKKKMHVEQSGGHSNVKKMSQNVFHFPEVLPSLDVSFELSPCPLRLQEFLLRMDVFNKTSSECFQVHQLSSVRQQWEISLLQPVDSSLPSQSLFAGQALSCFFILKDRKKSSTSEDSIPSLSRQSDVRLCPQDNSEAFFDVCSSPLADFHVYERSYQGMSCQACVDFVFISQLRKNNVDSGAPNTTLLFSHHACHCSLSSMSPISWLVDGPRAIQHKFSASLCEVNLKMTINNSSDIISSVHIKTFAAPSGNSLSINAAPTAQPGLPLENQAGWCDFPTANDTKIIRGKALATRFAKSVSLASVSQFIWSGSSFTKLVLQPRSTVEIPLQICVFAPGITIYQTIL